MLQVHLGSDADSSAETVAMTTDAARIEAGLETEDGSDLRVEFITVVRGHTDRAAHLVSGVAAMISQDPFTLSPQPGLLLPELASSLDSTMTAKHGLLVVPFLWEDGVPHLHEVATAGRRSKEAQEGSGAPVEFTHPGRLTLPVQLVMLTDEELDIAEQQGVDKLQQKLVETGADLHNPWR
ncbi:suppressor of fused domain protein [Corynebacterium auriscanis]|uniref:suppressor of fused domain protein n=2 Tax=Corynebacterium auriscanis TaxID=99807 RepID=UPI0024AD313D|nr:suppressor of fused domain protein [Corynebacterium auriscanis]